MSLFGNGITVDGFVMLLVMFSILSTLSPCTRRDRYQVSGCTMNVSRAVALFKHSPACLQDVSEIKFAAGSDRVEKYSYWTQRTEI